MKFAKVVFWIAGTWGLLIIAPLYFMFDLIGRKDPPPITHPGFFYGFVGLALAWQVAFLFIARDPVRDEEKCNLPGQRQPDESIEKSRMRNRRWVLAPN